MQFCRGILLLILCACFALVGLTLARAQDATSANVIESSTPVTPIPTPIPEKRRSKPSIEIPTETPSETPAPITKPPSSAEETPTPAATAEKKTRVRKRAAVVAQPEPGGVGNSGVMSISAARDLAITAPLPQYPYEAKREQVTGSGVCVMTIDTATGRVTSAVMAESTGNEILDKVTTHTFQTWRFKPRTVSQVRVPITYE